MTRIAIVGATGMLGSALVATLLDKGTEVVSFGRNDVDLEDSASMSHIADARPEAVINTAAWTDVDGCAQHPDRAIRVNGVGAGHVARAATAAGALSVFISTNEVFDGEAESAYTEEDQPRPINPYGASKLRGENEVIAAGRHLIIRTAWLFDERKGFPQRIRAAADRMAERGEPLRVVGDEWGNPTPVPALADRIARLLLGNLATLPSIIHLAGEPPTSRLDWARHVLREHPVTIEQIPLAAFGRPSRVPRRAVLATHASAELGLTPISWGDQPG